MLSLSISSTPKPVSRHSQQPSLLLTPTTTSSFSSSRMRGHSKSISQPTDTHHLRSPYNLRVSAVLLQCLDHLALIATILTPPPSTSTSHTSHSSTPPSPSLDLYTLLQQHHQLSSLFATLHTHRSHLSGLSNRQKLLALQSSLTTLSRHLTLSITTMSQQLQLSSDDKGQERKNRNDLDHLIRLIQRARTELGGTPHLPSASPFPSSLLPPHPPGEGGVGGSYDGLWREVKDEEAGATRVRAAKEQAERTSASIASLQAQLVSEEAAFASSLQALQAEVAAAHGQLRHHRVLVAHTVRYEQQSVAAKAEAVGRERRRRLEGLMQEVAELRRRGKESARVHRYNGTYLGWVRGGVERELVEWGERFEVEVGNDRERYSELWARRGEELKTLVERQRLWVEDEGRRREELRERQEMETEQRQRLEEEDRRERSARLIQFTWRVYWRRRKVQLKKLHKAWLKKQKAVQAP